MDVRSESYLSIDQAAGQYLTGQKLSAQTERSTQASFYDILAGKSIEKNASQMGTVKFSRHASVRLKDRGIELSNEQLERLNEGTQKAGQKGIKDSLVIVDELAFIVNVPSKTVVTAMDSTRADENVFTNINGAVIN